MEQYYLGFDAGTQSVKTAVYDIDMNLIVQDTNATILNYPHPGWVEMDADQYLHATVTGIRNCVTKMKEKNLDPDNIRSIFGDGSSAGLSVLIRIAMRSHLTSIIWIPEQKKMLRN